MGVTGGALLVHEILEQYRKQAFGEDFDTAHAAALAAEGTAIGAPRGASTTRAIEWQGNEAGYQPFLSPADKAAAHDLRPDDTPALIDALDHDERFVKAHIGLTRLTGMHYESFPAWNGLELRMRADGDVSIDPAQRERLARPLAALAGD